MKDNKKAREAFEKLSYEEKFKKVWPATQVLISMVRDTEFNMRKFLIPQGKMKEDSIFVTEFYKRFYAVFSGEKKDDKS